MRSNANIYIYAILQATTKRDLGLKQKNHQILAYTIKRIRKVEKCNFSASTLFILKNVFLYHQMIYCMMGEKHVCLSMTSISYFENLSSTSYFDRLYILESNGVLEVAPFNNSFI